jgi:hypothetical protein
MIFRRLAPIGAVLTVSTWGQGAIAAPGNSPLYAVIRVGSSLADEDRIGVKRAGLACLPNGVIRWGDVATGGNMDQREAVQDALEDAGLPVTPLGLSDDNDRRPALRLRAMVRAADFRVCARHYLGDAKAYSGDVALDIEWRIEGGDGGEVPHVSRVTRHIEGDRAASLGSIYRQLLGDAARDIAHWLLTPQS